MRFAVSIAGMAALITAVGAGVCAQEFDTVWTKTFWNGYFDSANCLQQTADGGFIITGMTKSDGLSDIDVGLIKTDADGYQIWSRTIGDTADECGYHVLPTLDGGYLISAQSDAATPGLGKLWVVKTDGNGDTVWTYMHDPLDPDENGFPLAAVQTMDSGYAVTGVVNISYDNKAFLLRLNRDGDLIEFTTYGGYSHQDGSFIAQLPDGGFIVAGNFNNPYSTQYDFWAFRTDESGMVAWDSIYAITTYSDIMYGACVVNDGLVMVGLARGMSHALKIDFDGHTVWSKSISKSSFNETVHTICPSPDSGFMVGGWIGVAGHRRDFCFSKLSPTGDTLRFFTVGGTDDDHGQWLVATSDGSYAMAGTSASFVDGECVYLVKAVEYVCGDANGNEKISVGDAVYIISYIFRGGPAPQPLAAGDANGDGKVNIGDAVYVISYIFRGGPAPCCP